MSLPPLPVIVNVGGGAASHAGDALREQVEGAFAAAGKTIQLELVDGDALADAIAGHAGSGRVAVGGGDGTLATAAQGLSESGDELAILPLGTRNHFAGQLGIPADLAAAAKIAVTGRARRVDLGQAGERSFINNFSTGAYVDLVREREMSRLPKLAATLPAAWRTLRKLRARRYELSIDGETRTVETPLLFIGNNRYEVDEGRPTERAALDEGLLSVYAAAPLSRAALLVAAFHALVGRPRMGRDFVLDLSAREIRVNGPAASIDVALDGEPLRCELPLTVRLLPRALAVVSLPENR